MKFPHSCRPRPGWETVVCIAGGPSLTPEQVEVVRNWRDADEARVIGVNNAYQMAPWVDALLAVDLLWWRKHIAAVRLLPAIETVSQDASAVKQCGLTTHVRGSAGKGLGLGQIHTGGNSGHAAVNLAHLWGARTIILLGYDMQPGPAGEKHWHADHPHPMMQIQLFDEWRKRFKATADDLAKLGIRVFNATPGSALECFPCMPLGEALQKAML